MSDQGRDPVVREFRDQISEADRAILDTVNRRLELVAQLHRYKLERGYPRVDQAREDSLVRSLVETNHGPLSEAGVRELAGTLIELSKREVGRLVEHAGAPRAESS